MVVFHLQMSSKQKIIGQKVIQAQVKQLILSNKKYEQIRLVLRRRMEEVKTVRDPSYNQYSDIELG